MGSREHTNGFQAVTSLGLRRMNALLDIMGNPHLNGRYIHVGGTNGKGSVCAFLESIALAGGLRVGKYTSPHLIRVNERIAVNGEEIPDFDLTPLLETVAAAALKVKEKIGEEPTMFERWTAAAFEYFSRKKCDCVILEVGLGGEFDATNVIKSNAAAVLCRIDLDHCALLGSTVGEIAKTKCGIIKDNSLTVTAAGQKEAKRVIEKCAAQRNNRLIEAKPFKSVGTEGICEKFIYANKEVLCPLGGLHQLENASIAAETARALGISDEYIIEGIEKAKNPARLEEVADSLFFDGAHNPNGVKALASTLERCFPNERQTVIFACMKDKDALASLKMLSSPLRDFIFTQVEGNPRSMAAQDLKALAELAGIDGEWRPNLTAAVRWAREKGNLTVICGSLYLYESIASACAEWKKPGEP